MLRLLLLRHAKSDWPDGVDDHDRPLAERGRRTSPLMAEYMAREGLVPDFALVSTARRTMETWDFLCPVFGRAINWQKEPGIYEAPARIIIDSIRSTQSGISTLLIIGHNPGLHDVALQLTGKGKQADIARLRQKYPTAGLVVIDFKTKHWADLLEQSGELERFVTPRTIQSI